MAESMLNIDIDSKLSRNRNISDILLNMPEDSSFGQMRGGLQNLKENNVASNSFTSFHPSETNSISPNNEDEEIPVVTIKNKFGNESKHCNNFEYYEKYQESQRILPLQVLDVFASEIITEKSRIYSFFGNTYKFTKIVGTIISKKLIKENKLNIGVDDGTGCISCIVETTEVDRQFRSNNDSLYEDICKHKVLDKDKLNKLLDMDDVEFFNNINENILENVFLTTTSKILLEKLKRNCNVFPFIEDIHIGANVVLIGQVSDYMGQRLIFVKNLKLETNLCNHLRQMTETLKYKEEIFKNK